jgi:DNA-directed RNA polymerase subunit M/transcription elongation factor TFIIS
MRWRQSFMAEVSGTLQRLGLRACPVCGSSEPLSMSHFPALLVDAGFPADDDGLIPGEDYAGDMTFAVRIECATCGHLMLFNSQRYRTGDEKILELHPASADQRDRNAGRQ